MAEDKDFKNYKEESRKNWGSKQNTEVDREQIKLGCVLRIADSLERMEKPYLNLLADVEFYKKQYQLKSKRVEELERSRSGLRSVITRLQNKISVLETKKNKS